MSVPLRNCDHQALSQVIQIREVADTYPLVLENAEPLTEDVGTNPKDRAQVKLMTSCAVGTLLRKEEKGSLSDDCLWGDGKDKGTRRGSPWEQELGGDSSCYPGPGQGRNEPGSIS